MPLRASASSCYRCSEGPRFVVAEANIDVPTRKQREETREKHGGRHRARPARMTDAGTAPLPISRPEGRRLRRPNDGATQTCIHGARTARTPSRPNPCRNHRRPRRPDRHRFVHRVNRRGNPLWLPRLSTGPAGRVIVLNDPNIALRPFAAPSGGHRGLPLRLLVFYSRSGRGNPLWLPSSSAAPVVCV